jgi:Ca2+-binding EF-hand superfamily protein
MSQLYELLETMVLGEDKLALCRDELKVDAERIFESMDEYRMGHVSMNVISRWVLRNCGFEVPSEDLARLQRKLDGGDDHRIGKEAFIMAVSAVPQVEEKKEKVATTKAK